MSYQHEREEFITRVTREGLDLHAAQALLRCATSINRYAELACSSEAADRDRVPCPRGVLDRITTRSLNPTAKQLERYPCLCDIDSNGHQTIPRIRLQDWRAEQRAIAAVPTGWRVITEGDPRGYTLKVIPPSYAERNAGRDRFNLEAIGVPAGPSRLRW